MGTGTQSGGGGPMMKIPAPSGGLTPAQPWTGMQPYGLRSSPQMPEGMGSGGPMAPPFGSPVAPPAPVFGMGTGGPMAPQAWRQATQPFGMLIPALLPGMMQQRGQMLPSTPTPTGAAPAPGTSISGGTGTFGTPAQIQAATPQAPRDPLQDLMLNFNYGGSAP